MSLSRGQRFLGYGLAGWCSEIFFTGLRRRGRDANLRLTGHTNLWMLPIYGIAAVAFEPADTAAPKTAVPWGGRGPGGAAGIYAVEAGAGGVRRAVTGEVPWDSARRRGRKPAPANWRGLVRPAYAPIWFAVGVGMEQLHDLFDRVEVNSR